MQFTTEQIAKAKTAKSAEELFAMAKAESFPMTIDEAQKIFAELHKQGELTDDELDAISGGKGEPDPKYSMNQHVWVKYANMGWGYVTDMYYNPSDGWHYTVHVEIVSFGGKKHIFNMTYTEDQIAPNMGG